uniref:hypothetical protein n=1 Tax=Clostridium sp. NkU-1 TaxID=1095009 RepID=UPI000AC7A22D
MKGSRFSNAWRYVLALMIIAVHFVPIYMVVAIAFKSPYDHSSRWAFPGYLYLKKYLYRAGAGRNASGP